MHKFKVFLSLAALTTAACGVPCPEGTVEMAGSCVPAETDAGTDAAVADASLSDGMMMMDSAVADDTGTETDAGNTEMDSGCTMGTYYADMDRDGYGNMSMTQMACSAPLGYVENATDCNDTCESCRPGGMEVCDAMMLDEDCTGGGNNGCECYEGQTRACPDGSSVGLCMPGMQTCASGHWGVCQGAIAPATELCDGQDNNCNTAIDDGAAASCAAVANGTPACTNAQCQATCNTNYANCDMQYANGCEVATNTVNNCGSCGNVCGWTCETSTCADATQMALGQDLSCAINEQRELKCWGEDVSMATSPWDATAATIARNVELVGAGHNHYCWKVGSQISCRGENGSGQSTSQAIAGVTHISGGAGHTCVSVGSRAGCWGLNHAGQIGRYAGANVLTVQFTDIRAEINEVDAAADHTCVRAGGGAMHCWGWSGRGQLGVSRVRDEENLWADVSILNDSLSTRVYVPQQVFSSGVSDIAVGNQFSCAVVNGEAYCWGWNRHGILGPGRALHNDTYEAGNAQTTRILVPGLSGLVEIDAGFSHVCTRNVAGEVYCWGSNGLGQVGTSTNYRTGPVQTPTRVQGLGRVLDIEANGTATCAIEEGGGMKCWGNNSWGQLGNGANLQTPPGQQATYVPTRVDPVNQPDWN